MNNTRRRPQSLPAREKRRAGDSRPVVKMIATIYARSASTEILFKERDRLAPRFLGMHRMKRRTIVAHEAVVGVGIENHLGRLACLLERVAKLVNFGDRDERIFAAEECQHRRLETLDIINRR